MTVLVLTSWHAAFDGRIFYKQCRTLSEIADVHLLSPGLGGQIFAMDGTLHSPGIYENVRCYPLKTLAKKSHVLLKIFRKFEQFFGIETTRIRRQALNYIKSNEISPDVIHVHEPELIPVARKIADLYRAKVIYDAHEMYVAYPVDRFGKLLGPLFAACVFARDRRIMPMCDVIFSVNELIRSYHLPLNPEAKSLLIENSSIIKDIPPASTSSKIRLVHEGSLSFSRGLRTMVELFQDPVIRDNYELHYVGKMGKCELQYLQHQPQEIQACFVDRGWVELTKLQDKLHGEIGLIMMEPKMNNILAGPPNKLYNYLAIGIPVLSVDLHASRMIIERHHVGEICSRDLASIKLTLNKMSKNLDFYQQNCLKAQNYVIWKNDAKKLLALYKEIVS